jgi:hypothetical protein
VEPLRRNCLFCGHCLAMGLHATILTSYPDYTYWPVAFSSEFRDSILMNWSTITFTSSRDLVFRSQWPRRLKHEPSSPARTLGWWVRIPFEAWIFVCIYSVCVVLCVGSDLPTGLSVIRLAFPQISYMHFSSPFVPHAPPISDTTGKTKTWVG